MSSPDRTARVAAILRIMGNTYSEVAALMKLTEDEARAAVWRGVHEANIENPEQMKPREEVRVARTYEDTPEYWLEVLIRWKIENSKRNELIRKAKKAGITITNIATALDVSRDTIYRWLEEPSGTESEE